MFCVCFFFITGFVNVIPLCYDTLGYLFAFNFLSTLATITMACIVHFTKYSFIAKRSLKIEFFHFWQLVHHVEYEDELDLTWISVTSPGIPSRVCFYDNQSFDLLKEVELEATDPSEASSILTAYSIFQNICLIALSYSTIKIILWINIKMLYYILGPVLGNCAEILADYEF